MEVFASNIPAEEWASELERCHDDSLENTDHTLLNENEEETRSELCPQSEPQKAVTENLHLDIQDMECMLNIFKTTKDCNKKEKWNSVIPAELLEYFSSTEKLICFLDVELRAVIRYLKKSKSCKLKESVAKSMKIQDIAFLLGLETSQSSPNVSKNSKGNMRAKKVKTLSELSASTVSKIPKFFLNIIYAEMVWPEKMKSWASDVENVTVEGNKYDWFYKPEFSPSINQYEVRCIDSTHLLTRTRTKKCKGGLENLNNNGWMKVAHSGKTLLTPVMIQESVDLM